MYIELYSKTGDRYSEYGWLGIETSAEYCPVTVEHRNIKLTDSNSGIAYWGNFATPGYYANEDYDETTGAVENGIYEGEWKHTSGYKDGLPDSLYAQFENGYVVGDTIFRSGYQFTWYEFPDTVLWW
jgi:hypothetical protein